MWLLHARKLQLEQFEGDVRPPYAILSHRWEKDEVLFADLTAPDFTQKLGYRKIDFCCKQALRDGLEYCWVDTCCIDKSSSSELSESINSMYKWYAQSTVCYVFMSDVSIQKGDDMKISAWFTRGWTLQELIAPFDVTFYDVDWSYIGTKWQLRGRLSELTGIPREALHEFLPKNHSIANKMSWASSRRTLRVEDKAYCLLGLFQVNMPLIYGEGDRAFLRLQQELLRQSDDLTIFCWDVPEKPSSRSLARSPYDFQYCQERLYTFEASDTVIFRGSSGFPSQTSFGPEGTAIHSNGFSVNMFLVPYRLSVYRAIIAKSNSTTESGAKVFALYLQRDRATGAFHRISPESRFVVGLPMEEVDLDCGRYRRILLRNAPESSRRASFLYSLFYGFKLDDIDRLAASIYQSVCQECDINHTATLYNANPHFSRATKSPQIELYQRGKTTKDLRFLAMHPGQFGTAGILRISASEQGFGLPVVILVFGFDFEFNPFCILLRLGQPGPLPVELDEYEPWVSIPCVSAKPLLLTNPKQIITLTEQLKQKGSETWDLRHDGISFHIASWQAEQVQFHLSNSVCLQLQHESDETYRVTMDANEAALVGLSINPDDQRRQHDTGWERHIY